ncbi:MAG: hypothetical protein JNL62_27910, partial [Bryobacterales bacterium]|nr:hypothetical protein [Bryobacterales bacterium]
AMTEPEIRAAVAALPETVKASLVDAAQCADSEGFEESLEEVRRHDPPVTIPLRALAEEFRFDRILALLASGERP